MTTSVDSIYHRQNANILHALKVVCRLSRIAGLRFRGYLHGCGGRTLEATLEEASRDTAGLVIWWGMIPAAVLAVRPGLILSE